MDKLGNRTAVTLRDTTTEAYTVYNQTNQYSAITGNNLTYDDAGNLTQDRDGYIYDYDYENRLVTVSLGGVGNLVVATFDYDALGRAIHGRI